ncbi:MAG: exosortase A [Undibacterium sp.]|uniref:exosortase A n=1 Tax=Undibacterium sp. TaxID=1914977 RepID=UPI002724FE81|nr:exosortase A [Undibacterium sp.]MDO8651009.1 exosortase A [Undibacterium sp.]
MIETRSSFYWKGFAIASALLAPFLVYFATAQSIVSIWNQSETFTHGYIILPISLWLIWKRRELILQMSPQPCWPALLALAGCGFGWLLAELADVQVVRQYMFVSMIPLSVIVVLGWRIAWAMAFPLFFLMLAVPFGEVFIAPLIDFTADFTITALQFTGIPVLREGSSFTIPSGSWSVVEACSGLRYLISSFTLGCLYAYLTYRSAWRRLLFILFSIIVPILANGMRAYMIVMIGHLSGMTLAVGVDHLIYGWLFFGLVMFFMFWVGSFWREAPENPNQPANIAVAQASAPVSSIFMATLSVLLCISLWPAYAAYVNRSDINTAPVQISHFQSNWPEIPAFTSWKTDLSPAYAELDRSYQKNSSMFGMHIGYYRNQTRSAGLIGAANRLVNDKHEWLLTSSTVRTETLGGRHIALQESRIKGLTGSILVWQWYWIDGTFMVNPYEGKLRQAKEKLLMRGDDGANLIFYAPYEENPDQARVILRDFLSSHLASLESTLNQSKKP